MREKEKGERAELTEFKREEERRTERETKRKESRTRCSRTLDSLKRE